MSDFDSALDGERPLSVGGAVTFNHIAQIGHQTGLGQVAHPVHACQVRTFLIGATNKVVHLGDGQVSHDTHGFLGRDRTQITRLATEVFDNFSLCGKTEAFIQPCNLAHFDFVEFVIAAQQ